MGKLKEIWGKAKWPFKVAVVAIGVAIAVKTVLWLEASGVLTNVK